jgi:preprotein translocase subunit SecB
MTTTIPANTPDAIQLDGQDAGKAQPFFGIQRIFLKGQSLELPLGAKLFLETGAPTLNLAIQIESTLLMPEVYEVSVRGTLTSTLGEKTLYLLEAEQAGIFEVRDVPPSQLADILEIGAPAILAPYLRTQLADSLTRATLPAFYMPEINWPVLAMERRAQAAGAPTTPSTAVH